MCRRLVFLACTLVSWLHLICGLSRDASHRVLKVLGIIITMVTTDTASAGKHEIPMDVRTAMKRLAIEPVINRSICCPKCYRAYSLEELPQICLAREANSSSCNTPLWVERQTRAGPKIDFPSWLSHFLSRPGMEPLLRKSHLHTPNPNRMSSIWDSPAWQSLGSFTRTFNNLVFAFYIDWFNPFLNKIAGKSASCGAIMANTFFEPTSTTITALCDPVMEQFLEMWHGKLIPTYDHPDGDMYHVLALKKALGFAGHRSHNFCSFCKLQRAEIDRLDHENFEPRSGAEHLHWSKAWLYAATQTIRKKIFKDHGCRWAHQVLGHHARLKWGIGFDAATGRNEDDAIFAATSSDSDVEMLAELQHDSMIAGDALPSVQRSRAASFVFMTDLGEPEDDGDYDNDEGIYSSEKPFQKIFDSEAMATIHAGLAGVADNWLVLFTIFFPLIIPELWHHSSSSPKDKKLLDNFDDLMTATNILVSYTVTPAEADIYLEHYLKYLRTSRSLFPGLTTRPNHHYAIHNGAQLKWWGPLVKLSEAMYETHNGSLQKIKTNNHMWEFDLTMLRQISRRGRLLASIRDGASVPNANSVVSEVLKVLLPNNLAEFSTEGIHSGATKQLAREDEAAYNGSGILLDSPTYELLLNYWNQSYSPSYIRAKELTYNIIDGDIPVFPSRAVFLSHFEHKTRLYSMYERHHGNSSISFLHPSTGHKDIGFIKSVWSLALQGEARTMIIVQPHLALNVADEARTPYLSRPGLACSVKYTSPTSPRVPVVVECRHVISHVAYFPRPTGTYGVKQEITIFVDSLHRNRD
ncbi:hypothetical protein C8R43DRAFT_1161073 [Mycena crocata]|nr:hypothetical protein C8R43DRAFT_1161073 [Mycena crocata]